MKKFSTLKNFVNGMETIVPRKNDSPYNRILAIGDIHLCFQKFMSLWKKLNVSAQDLCVFAGDFFDRGDEGNKMIEWLLAHQTKENFIFLAGNHELILINAFRNDRDLLDEIFSGQKHQLTYQDIKNHKSMVDWVTSGGIKTINALLKLQRKNKFIVDDFLKFVKDLSFSHTIEICGRKYQLCHVGIRPGISLDEQSAIDLLWIRKDFFHKTKGYNGNDVIIVGHTPTQRLSKRDKDGAVLMTVQDEFLVGYVSPEEKFDNTKPFKVPDRNILMLDTGSWRHSISCVDILSGQFWQSDEN